MKKILLISIIAAGLLTITGCGGNGDNGETPTTVKTTTLTSQFIDAAVTGISYDCQSSGQSGITDDEGNFNYAAGDTCTFSVGTVIIGSAKPENPIFTPKDLSSDLEVVTNILRLLQTLDIDEQPTNGIILPSGITGQINLGTGFDSEINAFLAQNNITASVVSAEDANAHFKESLSETTVEDSIDTNVTFMSVLKSGLYTPWSSIIDTNSTEIGIHQFSNVKGAQLEYEYNVSTDKFAPYIDKRATRPEIKLVNGIWVSKTVAEWKNERNANITLTFNGDNELLVSDGSGAEIITLTTTDVSGKAIIHSYPYYDVPTDALFSAGSKIYNLELVTTTFIPTYEIRYSKQFNCSVKDQCVEIPGNGNAEPYTSLTQFLQNKTLSFNKDGKNYIGVFGVNNIIKLYNENYSKLSVEGSYEMRMVDGMEILLLNLPDIVADKYMLQNKEKVIYSVQDGVVRSGSYQYDTNNFYGMMQFIGSWPTFNEVAAKDIYAQLGKSLPTQNAAPMHTSSTPVHRP